ncbi:MAG: GNAT family N-acetyltransferase [Clostridia bacterium]|nr:GNAT family N-acetyltransferase [Clostridia bacterium]
MSCDLNIRFAKREDAGIVLEFIKKIAEYEKMSDQVVNTEQMIQQVVFDNHAAEVILAEVEGKPVGFALFFQNYSTFVGKSGIYLEDLFVDPDMRGKGIGKALIQKIFAIALERNCSRVEWCCLDWNTPSIDFYKYLGAKPMSEWTTYRLAGADIKSALEK